MAKVVVLVVVGVMAVILLVPSVRQGFSRVLSSSETVVVPPRPGTAANNILEPGQAGQQSATGQEFKMVTLLGYDAIPAILDPEFLSAEEAQTQYRPDEQVLGLSINGDNRAYSIPMLSRHEIVNDEVGGVPLAVTW